MDIDFFLLFRGYLSLWHKYMDKIFILNGGKCHGQREFKSLTSARALQDLHGNRCILFPNENEKKRMYFNP